MVTGVSTGIVACEAAFERLKSNTPRLAVHVNLDPQKITAGVVSVEAGFDRGYLKKARLPHLELLAKIEAFRKEKVGGISSQLSNMKRAIGQAERAKSELENAQEKLYLVLMQNMQLVERVRALEVEVSVLKQKTQATNISPTSRYV